MAAESHLISKVQLGGKLGLQSGMFTLHLVLIPCLLEKNCFPAFVLCGSACVYICTTGFPRTSRLSAASAMHDGINCLISDRWL